LSIPWDVQNLDDSSVSAKVLLDGRSREEANLGMGESAVADGRDVQPMSEVNGEHH
jgi:hypothetical protein